MRRCLTKIPVVIFKTLFSSDVIISIILALLVGALSLIPGYFIDQKRDHLDIMGRWLAIQNEVLDSKAICEDRKQDSANTKKRVLSGQVRYVSVDEFPASALDDALNDPVFAIHATTEPELNPLNHLRFFFHLLSADNDTARLANSVVAGIGPNPKADVKRELSYILDMQVSECDTDAAAIQKYAAPALDSVRKEIAAEQAAITNDVVWERLSYAIIIAFFVLLVLLNVFSRQNNKAKDAG